MAESLSRSSTTVTRVRRDSPGPSRQPRSTGKSPSKNNRVTSCDDSIPLGDFSSIERILRSESTLVGRFRPLKARSAPSVQHLRSSSLRHPSTRILPQPTSSRSSSIQVTKIPSPTREASIALLEVRQDEQPARRKNRRSDSVVPFVVSEVYLGI